MTAGLGNAVFVGSKNANLMQWLSRQMLTPDARAKVAPQTVILTAGIKNIETPYPQMIQPNGEKISTFIKTDGLPPDVKATVERVLNIVDSIHGVGEMPTIQVGIQRGKLPAHAGFSGSFRRGAVSAGQALQAAGLEKRCRSPTICRP